MSHGPLAVLLDSLDLTALDDDRFEGRSAESTRPRAFGGELLAQALVAAARTAEERSCHSLHATFLLPGDPARPIEYRVRRVRDGRRFAQRQVTAWQRGREILLASASFTLATGETAEHQHEPMPQVPGPDGLRSELEHRRDTADQIRDEDRGWLLMPRAVEMRQVRPVALVDPPPVDPEAQTWLRAIGRLPDDPQPALRRARLCIGHDPARHRLLPARRELGRSPRGAGEPRSRHVVSPAVPLRRVAALRADRAGSGGRPGLRPRQRLHAGRARSSPPSRRKGCRASARVSERRAGRPARRSARVQQQPPEAAPAGSTRSGSQPQGRGPQSGVNTRPRFTVSDGTTARFTRSPAPRTS